MSSNNFPRVFLNSKEEKEIQQGFPWVFDNEISHVKYRADEKDDKSEWKNEGLKECSVVDGALVEVYTKAGGFLGTGVINKKSKITVRIIGSEHADVIMADTAEDDRRSGSRKHENRKSSGSGKNNKKKNNRKRKPKPSMNMNKKTLTKIALSKGIEIPEGATKRMILDLIYEEKRK